MAIRVCVAGVSGRTGSAVARAVLASDEFELTGAVARRSAGRDRGSAANAGSRCRPAWPRAARRSPGRAAG